MSSPWPKGYIVVVDMWSESHWKENTSKSNDTSGFYEILKSGTYFYNYLNFSLNVLANNGYHIVSHNTHNGYIESLTDHDWPKVDSAYWIHDQDSMHEHKPNIFFCGQHIDRCIQSTYDSVEVDSARKGIIVNLSLPFTRSTVQTCFNKKYNYYYQIHDKLHSLEITGT
jgi:hypothetical protein